MEKYTMFLGRINIVKMGILPNPIYRFHATPIKITNGIFHNNSKLYGHTRDPNSQNNLRKKSGAGGIILLTSRLYLQSCDNQKVWYWHKNIHIDQWNRIEHP